MNQDTIQCCDLHVVSTTVDGHVAWNVQTGDLACEVTNDIVMITRRCGDSITVCAHNIERDVLPVACSQAADFSTATLQETSTDSSMAQKSNTSVSVISIILIFAFGLACGVALTNWLK